MNLAEYIVEELPVADRVAHDSPVGAGYVPILNRLVPPPPYRIGGFERRELLHDPLVSLVECLVEELASNLTPAGGMDTPAVNCMVRGAFASASPDFARIFLSSPAVKHVPMIEQWNIGAKSQVFRRKGPCFPLRFKASAISVIVRGFVSGTG